MKIYIVQEIGYEYNDECYHKPRCGGGSPVLAFKSEGRAKAEAERLNREYCEEVASDISWEDGNGDRIDDFYEVVEVEMSDEDVEAV